MTDAINAIRSLLLPENRPVLWVVLILLIPSLALIVYLLFKRRLKLKIPFLETVPAESESTSRSTYRKILYVKFTSLIDRSQATAPTYVRDVNRLGTTSHAVPVYDEAVFYTLELLPKKSAIAPRKDRSSGVVDSRLVLPWEDDLVFRDPGAAKIKGFVQRETDQETDSVLAVSHFINGFQAGNQDVVTDVPQDAEYVRIVLDFSSIPESPRRITTDRAILRSPGRTENVPIAQSGPGLFTVVCRDVKKNSTIQVVFKVA